jgi:hypothetical protein
LKSRELKIAADESWSYEEEFYKVKKKGHFWFTLFEPKFPQPGYIRKREGLSGVDRGYCADFLRTGKGPCGNE